VNRIAGLCYAGVGSILLAQSNGKRPFVVPRLKAFGETVDDHQLESARRFAAADLVTLLEDPSELAAAIVRPVDASIELSAGPVALVAELRDYLAEITKPRLRATA
jgi:UDP-N-acetylglucosamine transferase subunit ALG13